MEGQSSEEKMFHVSEHPSCYMSKEDYVAGICLIPRKRRTQQRRGCNLIPSVHRKEHLSMKHSTQQTMTKKAVQKEEECLAEPAGRQAGNAPKRTRSGRVVRPSLRYRDWPQWLTILLSLLSCSWCNHYDFINIFSDNAPDMVVSCIISNERESCKRVD